MTSVSYVEYLELVPLLVLLPVRLLKLIPIMFAIVPEHQNCTTQNNLLFSTDGAFYAPMQSTVENLLYCYMLSVVYMP